MTESKLKAQAMDSVGEIASKKPRFIKITTSCETCNGCVAQFDELLCASLPKCSDWDCDDNLIKSYIFKVKL